MSKKKHPTNKRKSMRGHQEGNVIRFLEKKDLIRVDREGNPLNRGAPINTFDKNWLSGQLLSDISAPPIIPTRTSLPNNVTSITKGKPKVDKPVSQTGNEAEVVKPPTLTTKHGWLHDKHLATAEFRGWSRVTKEIGRTKTAAEVWTKDDKGKLHSLSLDHQRELSKQGRTKLKFKSPPSTVHNPFLTPDASSWSASNQDAAPICLLNERNRNRDVVLYAPSGLPISEFITGKYKPQNAVVYTTVDALPPTPTRDWRASNDKTYDTSVKVRRTPDLNSWAYKTNGMVQWFINHVEPQNWPTHVHNFVSWNDGGPVINTGAINKAASHPETELILVSELNSGLEQDWKMIDSALSDAQSENNLLRQELKLTQQELAQEVQRNKLMEYDIAMRNGEAPEIIRDSYDIIKPKTPDVPDDADVMLAQFNVYQSFVKCDGPEHAFARYVYGDPRLGEVIRDHADMRCNQRQSDVGYRNVVRFLKDLSAHILSEMQAEYEQKKHDEYESFWQTQYPLYLLHRKRRNISAVCNPSRESVALAALARKAKPATYRNSLYYSTLDNRDSYLTNVVAKCIIQQVKPSRERYNNPHLVDGDSRESWAQPPFKGINKYEQWWAERIDYCEVHYHQVNHPIKVGIVKAYNKLVDTLNTPIDPSTRSRNKRLREQMKLKQVQLDEKREQRSEQRSVDKQRKRERDHIRKMQRIAH